MSLLFIIFAAVSFAVDDIERVSQDIKAFNPTSAGQIGVNIYPFIGSNTKYYIAEQTTTRWIGVDSVIVTTITKTSGGLPMTTTKSRLIAVSTATQSSAGKAVGDLSFIISPAAKAKLHDVFTKAVSSCGGRKGRKRQVDPLIACALKYIETNEPGLMDEIREVLGELADGAGNLIEYIFAGVEVGTVVEGGVALGSALISILLGWWVSSANPSIDSILGVVDINANQIGKVTASSAKSSSRPTPSPLLIPYPYREPAPYNAISASAIASYLEQRFSAMEPTSVPPKTSTTPAPKPTAEGPIFKPTNAKASCNAVGWGLFGVPSYVQKTDTSNKKAAAIASKQFCEVENYQYNMVLAWHCPWWGYYTIDGSEIISNERGEWDSAKYPFVYFAMTWDFDACSYEEWYPKYPMGLGWPGGKYTQSRAIKEDCALAFQTILNECDTKEDETHGGKISFKCIKYFMFPSWNPRVDVCGNGDSFYTAPWRRM